MDFPPPPSNCIDRCDEKEYFEFEISTAIVIPFILFLIYKRLFVFLLIPFILIFAIIIKRFIVENFFGKSCPCRFF